MSAVHKSECPGSTGHCADNQTSNDLDFPTVGRKSKAISTAVAQLALHGYAVFEGSNGDFIVCQHGMSQYCQDPGELQVFARLMGAQS